MKIGSLCTGYGGLDMAVEAYFNAETIWVSEIDKYASQVIQQRFGVVNHGDLKTINWAEVEPIDILTAGYPCQPFSHAGYRKGTEDERHIWPFIKEAISHLRPSAVVLENVRGHLSLGFKEVLKDLAEIGYDAKWQLVRASDVGAPHQRARLFVIANPISVRCQDQLCGSESSESVDGIAANSHSCSCEKSRRTNISIHGTTSEIINGSDWNEHRSGCSANCNADNKHKSHNGQVSQFRGRFTSRCEMPMQTAPNALDQLNRLNPEFVEYMMGLPVGWVTDTGLSRTQQLKMLGNGVVPQQAYYALELLGHAQDHA
jgi:DNA (cytosine-5)-methyltransferase 1